MIERLLAMIKRLFTENFTYLLIWVSSLILIIVNFWHHPWVTEGTVLSVGAGHALLIFCAIIVSSLITGLSMFFFNIVLFPIGEKLLELARFKFYRVLFGAITGITAAIFILIASTVIGFSWQSGFSFAFRPKTITASLIIGGICWWLITTAINVHYKEKGLE